MEPKTLGRLLRIDAREAWTHEAHDFTPWLHADIGLLAEALGFDIETTGREVAVGDFSVDVVGRTTPGGRPVIVENQLAPTDHSHLGQLLTYASGLDAAVIRLARSPIPGRASPGARLAQHPHGGRHRLLRSTMIRWNDVLRPIIRQLSVPPVGDAP